MTIDNFFGRSIEIESKPVETQEGEHRAARTAKSSSFQTILLRLISTFISRNRNWKLSENIFLRKHLRLPRNPQGYLAVNNNYQQLPNKV